MLWALTFGSGSGLDCGQDRVTNFREVVRLAKELERAHAEPPERLGRVRRREDEWEVLEGGFLPKLRELCPLIGEREANLVQHDVGPHARRHCLELVRGRRGLAFESGRVGDAAQKVSNGGLSAVGEDEEIVCVSRHCLRKEQWQYLEDFLENPRKWHEEVA